MSGEMTEDRLVQEATANYFQGRLGWNSVYAYDTEILGTDGTLGRTSQSEVVLVRYLRAALVKLNPKLPDVVYESAIKQITEISYSKNTLQMNRGKYSIFKNGILISYRDDKGQVQKCRLQIFDFDKPENNHFLVVRELWIQGRLYRRRPDIIGFVNGISVLFIELKNVHKDIRRAYEGNLSDYKDTIPHLFDHNAFIILSNGEKAKVGSISSKYEHFTDWKRLSEEEPGVIDLETMLKGMCTRQNFMDLFENFILFDESTRKLTKIIGRNHQFLGVNRAIEAIKNRKVRKGQLGVFWHTQGSGKSYSIVFLTQKVHRKLPGNYTFLIVTDREDLENQIYKTFVGTDVIKEEGCRASSGDNLREILRSDLPYVFTMIHKFNKLVDPDNPYSRRDDIIVISDEAHRTQYGQLALNMRQALPNAGYIGFTGTPLFKEDEITKRIFGDYISTYDFQRAVEDNATVPLFYDNRGEKLHITTTEINEKMAAKLEETELDPDQQARLEKELAREYHIITAKKRLEAIAKDFVKHYSTRWETGKAMIVCIDKITTVRVYDLIQTYWQEQIEAVDKAIRSTTDEQEAVQLQRQHEWMNETEMAVVISEEQGEVKLFRDWGLDIIPHREKIKNGYETPDGKRLEIDFAFKDPDHRFRVAIVCAMWMTGFDVPSLSTLYLDKPLRAHTLMQAIARANRVHEGKNNGLIVDYCGILKNLRQALATFAIGGAGKAGEPLDPVKPEEELIEELAEAVDLVRTFLNERDFVLDDLYEAEGFAKIRLITKAKEAINQNDETRKRFEILAREVFRKFKTCLTIREVHEYRKDYGAIDIIYKRLQGDRDAADISEIIKELHTVVEGAIEPTADIPADDIGKTYDISKIDFDRLRAEFEKSPKKNTTVQCLKEAIEKRLQRMIEKNPLRMDFNQRYQEIIAEYNKEKDRITIEETFAALLKFVDSLDEEDKRAVREGLDDENLALFDLLIKPNLTPRDRNRLKEVAKELLRTLKEEKLRVDNFREKESTKADVKTFIHDFLWDEKRGLPIESYTPEEVEAKAEIVYNHILKQYSDAEHSVYAA